MTTPNDLTYEIEDEFESFRFNLQEFQRTSDQEHWFEAVKSLKYLVELVEELQSAVDRIN